jgi:hypothetical protein
VTEPPTETMRCGSACAIPAAKHSAENMSEKEKRDTAKALLSGSTIYLFKMSFPPRVTRRRYIAP